MDGYTKMLAYFWIGVAFCKSNHRVWSIKHCPILLVETDMLENKLSLEPRVVKIYWAFFRFSHVFDQHKSWFVWCMLWILVGRKPSQEKLVVHSYGPLLKFSFEALIKMSLWWWCFVEACLGQVDRTCNYLHGVFFSGMKMMKCFEDFLKGTMVIQNPCTHKILHTKASQTV